MASTGAKKQRGTESHLLKTSLNAFSFNDPLKTGAMRIDDMIRFCSDTGFDGVDLTAYYFPEYPAVPSDELLYKIKRGAFL